MSRSTNKASDKSTNVRLQALRLVARGLAAAAPELAVWGLERFFLTPPRHRPPARERLWLKGAVPGRIECGLHRLHTWSWSGGPTVLLVHGWGGRGSQMGAFAQPLAGSGFRVVTFDAPGHGRSSGRRSSLVEMADGVAAVAARLGPLSAVIAHSAGAAVTTMALARGLEVEQAVYLAPPSNPGTFLYGLAEMLGLGQEIPRRTQRRIEERLGIRWDELTNEVLAPRMRIPLLVVHDRDDRQVPWSHGRDVADAWPGARLFTTTRLGHLRLLRDPGVVTTVVQHLRRRADRRPGPPAAAVTCA